MNSAFREALDNCWVSRAGTENALTALGCKALLWISLSYSWIQRPAKDSPGGGKGSPLSSPTTRDCGERAGFGHGRRFPRSSPLLSVFIIWGNFLLGLLYIYYGEFLLVKIFLRRQSLKRFYFFFSRHLWVLTRYIIYRWCNLFNLVLGQVLRSLFSLNPVVFRFSFWIQWEFCLNVDGGSGSDVSCSYLFHSAVCEFFWESFCLVIHGAVAANTLQNWDCSVEQPGSVRQGAATPSTKHRATLKSFL